jgi:hypothetical protein
MAQCFFEDASGGCDNPWFLGVGRPGLADQDLNLCLISLCVSYFQC